MLPAPPLPRLATIANVQQAISQLLITREPQFQHFGETLFLSLAAIVLCWKGVRMMLAHHHGVGDHTGEFAQFMLVASFNYAMLVFYESPIPGIGVSFSNLITDQTSFFMNILDARSLEHTFTHLDILWTKFVVPDAWSILGNLVYWVLLLVLTITKGVSLAVVAFGLIASAVCALLGPIFIPFLIVPMLDWLFWGWLKAFLQYSMVPVVALAYLMVGEQFIYMFVSAVPPGVTEDQYPLYALQAIVVIGTFAFGILLVPALTSSLFSGYSHAGTTEFLGAVLKR